MAALGQKQSFAIISGDWLLSGVERTLIKPVATRLNQPGLYPQKPCNSPGIWRS